MAGVSSEEPSSTTTQAAGVTDCAATLSSVRRMKLASSRQGEMSRYRREAITENSLEMVWQSSGRAACAAAVDALRFKSSRLADAECRLNGFNRTGMIPAIAVAVLWNLGQIDLVEHNPSDTMPLRPQELESLGDAGT